MASVLETLYVDVVQRGLESARAGVDSVRQRMTEGMKTARQYKQAMEDASGSMRYAGGGVTDNTANSRGAVSAAAQSGRSIGSAGGSAMLSGAAATKAMAGAVGLATAAVTAFTAAIVRGLQGTVELERFNRGMALVSREMANLVGPALSFFGDSVQGAVALFRELGPSAQVAVVALNGLMAGLVVLKTVFTDPAMVGALGELKAAFGQLAVAAKPLINQFAFLTTELIRAGIVAPLVKFARLLTYAAQALTMLTQAAARGMRVLGFGGMQADRGQRTELRLNQTGTEDAQGTFARIQEAVLRAAMPEEADPAERQVDLLGDIKRAAEAILDVLNKPKELAQALQNPSTYAAGATGVGLAIGTMLNPFSR